MVSTIVYADDGGNGGNGSGAGNGGSGANGGGDAGKGGGEHGNTGGDAGKGGNGSNGGDGANGSNGGDAGKGGNSGGDAGHGSSSDGGHGNVGGRENSNHGNVNHRNAVYNPGISDQKSTSNASGKTAIPHMVLAPTVQAPVVVLLATYSGDAEPSASGTWWSLVESYVEELFRKFLFLFGSIGEKIRRKDVLRNSKRREIYYFVVNNPFSHFRRITRMVRAGPNQCFWHLRILEKMGLIKSEHVGRYLTYHASNSDYIGSRSNRPATFSNSNATKILEYLRMNPGVKIAHLSQALMMNRHTVSYHIKCMLTNGLVERVERNSLRLSPIAENQGEGLTHLIANSVAPEELTNRKQEACLINSTNSE